MSRLTLKEESEILAAQERLPESCPDCAEAKRAAYSDATTAGFFYDRCNKHRATITAFRENPIQKQVAEFHRAGGHLINNAPTIVDEKTRRLREALIAEEAGELFDAMRSKDLIGIADALADLAYVLFGTAISYGINLQPISDEVHRSNMTKFAEPGAYTATCDKSGKSIKNELGKTLKPPCFEPPNIAREIELQRQQRKDASPVGIRHVVGRPCGAEANPNETITEIAERVTCRECINDLINSYLNDLLYNATRYNER